MRKFSTISLRALAAVAVVFLSFTACRPDDVDNPVTCQPSGYVNQAATGKFMDTTYTVITGKAREDSFDSTKYRFSLYGETPTGDMCDNFNFDLPRKSIIFILPKATGAYPLSSTRGVTFNYALPNQTTATVATCGNIEITSITATTITGKIEADAKDAMSLLNGNFTVELCQ
jgi:hypothetical protein